MSVPFGDDTTPDEFIVQDHGTCENCGEEDVDLCCVPGYMWLCEDCFANMDTCDICGEKYVEGALEFVELEDGRYVCPYCAEELESAEKDEEDGDDKDDADSSDGDPEYLDEQGIKDAFAAHLMKSRGYSADEAMLAVSDFPDPYRLPYLDEDFVGDVTIDGVDYEKRASYTCLWKVGMDDVPMFRFYTLYREEDIPHNQVGEYMTARKLYQVKGLDDDDFPDDDRSASSPFSPFFF